MRSPYSLQRRWNKKGKQIYYAAFWDEARGRYSTVRSTGQTTKGAALAVIQKWTRDGLHLNPSIARTVAEACRKAPADDAAAVRYLFNALIEAARAATEMEPERKREIAGVLADALVSLDRDRGVLFVDFLGRFWDWDCSSYIKRRIAEGHSMGKAYALMNKSFIRRFASFFAARTLVSITTADVEAFKAELCRRDMNSQTVNRILQAVAVPLREAHRLGLIAANPAAAVAKLAERPKERGIFTPAEIRALLEAPEAWPDARYHAAALLAATTGMRLGEIIGLQAEDVLDGVVHVKRSWSTATGLLKETKTRKTRVIPIPPNVQAALSRLIEAQRGSGFVFPGVAPDIPLPAKSLQKMLYRLLDSQGIDRQARNLSWHSFRHTANAELVGALGGEKARLVTGHTGADMTRAYDHVTEADAAAIRRAQLKIVGAA